MICGGVRAEAHSGGRPLSEQQPHVSLISSLGLGYKAGGLNEAVERMEARGLPLLQTSE